MANTRELSMAVPRLIDRLERLPEPSGAMLELEAPFVGRRDELETMYGVAREAAAEGTLRQICLRGGAGTGKTRLCNELRELMESADTSCVFHVASTTEGPTSAFVLCAQILRRRFDISAGDGDTDVQRKLEDGVSELDPPGPVDDNVALLGSLIGLRIPTRMLQGNMPHPAAFRRRALRTLGTVLARDAESALQVVLLDGLHWIGQDHTHYFAELLDELRDAGALAILTSREEIAHPPALDDVPTTEVTLDPLPTPAAMLLLSGLLGGLDPSAERTLAPVVDASDGNPRRLKELVGLLVSHDVIEVKKGRLVVHSSRLARFNRATMTGEIRAGRLDRLDAGRREVLTCAAVFGPRFWFDGVLSLLWAGPHGGRHALPAEDRIERGLHRALLDLMQRGIVKDIQPSQIAGSIELSFTDEDEREELLRSVKPKDLARLRSWAARWMLGVQPLDAQPWYRRAAELFDAAGFKAEAAEAWIQCATAAAANLDNDAALTAFEKADAEIPVLRADARCHIQMGRSRVLEQMGEPAGALESWNKVFRCARILGNRVLAADVMVAQGRLLQTLGKLDAARDVLNRALAAYQELQVADGRAAAEAELGRVCEASGKGEDLDRAIVHYERAVGIWRDEGQMQAVAGCLAHMSRICVVRLDLRKAREAADEASKLFFDLKDERSWARSLNLVGSIHHLLGRTDAAIQAWRTASQFAADGYPRLGVTLQLNLSDAYIQRGDLLEAQVRAKEALTQAKGMEDDALIAYANHRLAMILLRRGHPDHARRTEEKVLTSAREREDRELEAMALRGLAEAMAAEAMPGQVAKDAVKAVIERFELAVAKAEGLGDPYALLRALGAFADYLELHEFKTRASQARVRAEDIWTRLQDGSRAETLPGHGPAGQSIGQDRMVLPALEDLYSEAGSLVSPRCGEPFLA